MPIAVKLRFEYSHAANVFSTNHSEKKVAALVGDEAFDDRKEGG